MKDTPLIEWIHGLMALAAALAAFFAWLAKRAITEVHVSINSRMDALLAEARKLAHMQGVQEERDKSK